MPELVLSQNILSADANYRAEDWASFGASTALDTAAAATLRRGINLELGAEALVRLDASIHKFLAADAQGQAHAAARVQAQVQVPLDLFAECGAAIRLQAKAEAAAGITLGLGLSIGEFIELAPEDPRMGKIALQLLIIFLEELTVQGGVMAKVAASAMAYANLALTGRLIPSGTAPAGFTVAAEAGLGLEAGAGFRVHAAFGLNDPRRLLRRSVDAVVDETLAAIGRLLPSERERASLSHLRAPAKMALRAAFELGLELAANPDAFDPAAAPRLSQRCVQAFLEEAQRVLLEQFASLGLQLLREELGRLELDQPTWDRTQLQRAALADRLEKLPTEPFEPTPQNEAYWLGLAGDVTNLMIALGAQDRAGEAWIEALALAWAASQLLFVSVKRISEASARASVIGLPPAQTAPAFAGDPPAQPPETIRKHINARLGRGQAEPLKQEQLVAFLLRSESVERLLGYFPEAQVVFDLVSGRDAAAATAAASTILNNIGAFASGAGGGPDPEESLRVIVLGLQAYMDTRVAGELEPMLREALATADPDLRIYLDEVLLGSLRFTVKTIFSQVLAWTGGSVAGKTALREACSAILMRLFGRSLVVMADVLLNKALAGVSGGFRDAADHVNVRGGVAELLASLTSLDRALVAEIMEETLQIAAEAFSPLPDTRRARIRDLLYGVIDTMPAAADASFLDQLKSDLFVPNLESARDLALELGGMLSDTFVRFIRAFLDRVGRHALELLQDVLRDLEQGVVAWAGRLEDLVRELVGRLQDLANEIEEKLRQFEDELDAVLGAASSLLDAFAQEANKQELRTSLRDVLLNQALAALAQNEIYANLPKEAKKLARDILADAVDLIVGTGLVDPVLTALSALAGETATFLEDVRGLEPGDDLVDQIINLFADRIEDAMRGAFGYQNPGFDIKFNVWGYQINLGRVEAPLDQLVAAIRGLAVTLKAIEDQARGLAEGLTRTLWLEGVVQAAEAERDLAQAQKDRSDALLSESRITGYDAVIVQPAAATVLDRDATIEILLPGVPRSWLGLADDEAQRVYVSLNQEEIALSRFQVAEIGVAGSSEMVAGLTAAKPVARLETIAAGREKMGRPAFGAHPVAAAAAARHDRGASSRPAIAALAISDGSARADAARGLLRRPGSVSVHRGGKPRSDALAGAPTLGRGMSATDLSLIVAAAPPGLILRCRIPLAELAEGANTLVVAVLGGQQTARIEVGVTFLALPASDRVPAMPMPEKPVWERDTLPDWVAVAVAGRFGEDALSKDATPRGKPRHSAGGFWLPRQREQKKRIARAAKVQRERLAQRSEALARMRAAVQKGMLRPATPPSPQPPLDDSSAVGRHQSHGQTDASLSVVSGNTGITGRAGK